MTYVNCKDFRNVERIEYSSESKVQPIIKIMKQLIIFLFLLISTLSFGQVNSKTLIGKWKYENTTDVQDSVIKSSVHPFMLDINNNKTYKIAGTEFWVSGTWQLQDSALILTGKRNDQKNNKTENMKIHLINSVRLAFIVNLEAQNNALINLVRIE